MTEEELEQLAEEYKKKVITENKSLIPNEVLYLSPIKQAFKDGYKQGQESMLFEFALEDRGKLLQKIEELQAQIKKMKCCGNCKYYQWYDSFEDHVCCFEQHGRHTENTNKCDKWELAK